MPKLQEYYCGKCGEKYEYLHMDAEDTATCPACGSTKTDMVLGGQPFHTIVPTYPGAMRHKAGYVHKYANRPAEKISVSVPRTKGASK